MPIEFRCTQCGRLLQTPDDSLGKQAKCPECGAVMLVPARPAGPPPGSPFAPGGPQPEAARGFFTSGVYEPSLIDFGDVFGRTWIIFKAEWGMCLAVLLVAWVIGIAVSVVCGLVPILGDIVASLFNTWIAIGATLYFLKVARGRPAEIGDIFTGGPYFISVLLAQLLLLLLCLGVFGLGVGIPVLIGLAISQEAALILGILAGSVAIVVWIILMLMFAQFWYLILDQKLGPVDCLFESARIMRGNKLTLFLVQLVATLATVAVAICTCLIGLFFAAPFLALLYVVIYLSITGQPTADQLSPTPPQE